MHAPCKRGFTLIELLVVIAIIAILAAILFPVFSKARDKARSVQCLSGMKQVGNALAMYLRDWNGTVPPTPYTAPYTDRLVSILKPYVKNDRFWWCPSMPPNTPMANQQLTNFWLNFVIYNAQEPGSTLFNASSIALRKVDTCPKPSSVFYFTEGSWGGNARKFPHNDGVNAVYIDGHAAWVAGDCYYNNSAYLGRGRKQCPHTKMTWGVNGIHVDCEKFLWGWDVDLAVKQ